MTLFVRYASFTTTLTRPLQLVIRFVYISAPFSNLSDTFHIAFRSHFAVLSTKSIWPRPLITGISTTSPLKYRRDTSAFLAPPDINQSIFPTMNPLLKFHDKRFFLPLSASYPARRSGVWQMSCWPASGVSFPSASVVWLS